jgi:phospholipid N-methyltransferase
MKQQVTDRLRFFKAFVAHPRQVGAVLPTSRSAVRDMLDLADLPGADLVVELGAGTGSQTGQILERLHPGARLLALEIDPALAALLDARYDDPRLQVVCASAEQLSDHLDGRRADVVVCALPFTSLEQGLRRRILDQLPRALSPRGSAVVIQYSPIIEPELRRRFGSVRRRISPRNVPPAFLFACTSPLTAPGGATSPGAVPPG